MEPMFLIFGALSIILLITILYESQQIRKYNEQFEQIAESVITLGTAFNTNTEIQRNDRVVMREAVVDITMIKQILEIHAKGIDIPLPKQEWSELVKVIQEASK